jgi:formylglycine-generating enzyme required for sulfatase activity
MKKLTLLALTIALASCSKDPNVAVRIDCGDYNDKGLQATLNGQPVGDCPVDIMVHAGEVNVSARKDNDDASYLFAEAKMTLAENAMKRIKLDIQPVYTEEYYYRKATDITGMQAYLEKQPDGQRKAEVEQRLKTERAKLENLAPGLVMVQIPAGSFMMGCSEGDSDCADDEKPRHQVNISTFALSKTEITFAQYDAFAKATKRELPKDYYGRGDHPVINISWHDAVAYTQWLSEQTGQEFRLPSEAEWEYAARAGSTSKYSWGNSIDCSKARYDGGKNSSCYHTTRDNKPRGTSKVAQFAANAFGLHDMHGNVLEWTADCWNNSYNNSNSNNTALQKGNCDARVARGGSWACFGEITQGCIRVSNRVAWHAERQESDHGFRLAQDTK